MLKRISILSAAALGLSAATALAHPDLNPQVPPPDQQFQGNGGAAQDYRTTPPDLHRLEPTPPETFEPGSVQAQDSNPTEPDLHRLDPTADDMI